MKRNLPLIIIAVVLIGAFTAGALMYSRMKPAQPSPGSSPATAAIAPGADPPRVRGGGASAPVTIEEFGDFECPPCGSLHPILKEIEKELGDRLRVVFRHNPLPTIHKHAYDAARAAEAAGMQGKFWEMHDMLYEKQNEWTLAPDPREQFTAFARALGLDANKFMRDMGSDLTISRVTLDMRRAKSMGVTGTPTLFLNGKQVNANDMTGEGLRRAINNELVGKQ
jgi:protein-disulfide isomerase